MIYFSFFSCVFDRPEFREQTQKIMLILSSNPALFVSFSLRNKATLLLYSMSTVRYVAIFIIFTAISFIVIDQFPSSSSSVPANDIPPLPEVPLIITTPTTTTVTLSPQGVASSSPIVNQFIFPSYTSSPLDLTYFPNHGAQIRATSRSLFSASKASSFETSYQKIDCGAMITNFCIWKGQPRYFRQGKRFFSSTGATRCCNEGETKFRFHSVMYDPIVVRGELSSSSLPAPWQPDTILVVPMCWEQYGYHLFLCLLNTWSIMSKLSFDGDVPKKVKIALLKSWSGENLLGSTTDWWNGSREGVDHQQQQQNVSSSKSKKSIFWAWWSVVADQPADVIDVASLPRGCFPFGTVAGKIDFITPGMQQQFRSSMLNRLRILPSSDQNDKTIRVTIVDRQKNFKLLNRDQIAKQFQQSRHHYHHQVIVAQGVVFENLPSLKEQMTIAASTDVLVGMHGNGLTWSAFLNPGTSALVELWPSYIYNGNYAHFAGRGNIKKWDVVAGVNKSSCPSNKRCNAEILIDDAIVKEVLDFVVATKIDKTLVYRGDEEYLKTQARYGKAKKNKKKFVSSV